MAETVPQLRKDINALQVRVAELEAENAQLMLTPPKVKTVEVIKEVPVEVEVVREVTKEVPVEVEVIKEVVREVKVPVEVIKTVIKPDPKLAARIIELEGRLNGHY